VASIGRDDPSIGGGHVCWGSYDGFNFARWRSRRIPGMHRDPMHFRHRQTDTDIIALALCYDVKCPSVCDKSALAHYSYNLCFKFRSKFTAHCGRGEDNLNNNIYRAMIATARPSCSLCGSTKRPADTYFAF